MTLCRLAGEAVVEFGERHEPLVHRQVVLRVRALHPESLVDVQDQAGGVIVGHRPIDSERSTENQREPGSFAFAGRSGGGKPQSGANHGFERRCAEILPHRRRQTQVLERPGAHADVEASRVSEELDAQGHRADATERDPKPHPVAGIGPLGHEWAREHREKQDEFGCGSGQDVLPAGALKAVDARCVVGQLDGRRIIEPPARRVYGRLSLIVVLLLPLLTACQPPDQPSGLDLTVPEALLDWLEPDSVRRIDIHPGVAYRYLWSAKGPWAVHIVQASIAGRCDLGFEVLRAGAREDGGGGRETVSGMVSRSELEVLAAINADFFTPEGTTVGAEVTDGVVRAVADRPAFAWRPGRDPWLGVARGTADELQFGWSVARDGGDAETEAVGGFPDLIDGGQRVGDLEVGARPSFAAARHPRSAIGYDRSRGQIWIVLVDGRQSPHSVGMTLPEIARLFESVGTDEALNLDGGGSSALVVAGAPVNRPSDPTGERAVVNALALITSSEWCAGP